LFQGGELSSRASTDEGRMRCPKWLEGLLHYSSVRYVQVSDMRLGILFRVMQLSIIGYVIGYSIVLQKSYQRIDPVKGTSTIKIKGSGYMNNTGSPIQVYDAQDIVMPPTMQGAFFVTTRFVETYQTRDELCSVSPDGSSNSGQKCTTDADCTKDETTFYGLMTGKCVAPYCEIQTWCPLEDDPSGSDLNKLHGIRNFSIFIRTNVQFPLFDITLTSGKDPVPGLSLFRMSDMLAEACDGVACDFEEIRENGAVLLAKAHYDCDEDSNVQDCFPTWDFSRIDEGDGFNYRMIQYVNPVNETHRVMKKLYGIRVVVTIYGQAGQFFIVNLLVALGAGLGLLSVASILADFMLQNCWPKREKFLHDKFCNVDLEVTATSMTPISLASQGDYKLIMANPLEAKYEPRGVPNPLLLASGDDGEEEDKFVPPEPVQSNQLSVQPRKVSHIPGESMGSSLDTKVTGAGIDFNPVSWGGVLGDDNGGDDDVGRRQSVN